MNKPASYYTVWSGIQQLYDMITYISVFATLLIRFWFNTSDQNGAKFKFHYIK